MFMKIWKTLIQKRKEEFDDIIANMVAIKNLIPVVIELF